MLPRGIGRMTKGNMANRRFGSGSLSRRAFMQFGAAATGTVLLSGPLALTGCGSDTGDRVFRGTRNFTDDAGRELSIPTPEQLERIYFTSALAQVFCFTLNPELQVGVSSSFSEEELELLPERLRTLPFLGSLSGDGEIDREALLAEKVQLIFSISTIELTEENISEAEMLQEQTKIPVVLIDGSFENLSNAYRELGDIFGVEERADQLASYCDAIYKDVSQAASRVPENERLSLYYAEGPLGLQTEPDISQHALVFHVAGANNVAAVEETQGLGMTNVSLEQVLAWDPRVIIAWDDEIRGGADERIRTNPDWSKIRAVQDKRVYTMPDAPFSWCDRPAGVNRYLGLQWVCNMLYPDKYDVDMVEEVKKFYSLMYWVDITDEKAKELLGNSSPPYGAA